MHKYALYPGREMEVENSIKTSSLLAGSLIVILDIVPAMEFVPSRFATTLVRAKVLIKRVGKNGKQRLQIANIITPITNMSKKDIDLLNSNATENGVNIVRLKAVKPREKHNLLHIDPYDFLCFIINKLYNLSVLDKYNNTRSFRRRMGKTMYRETLRALENYTGNETHYLILYTSLRRRQRVLNFIVTEMSNLRNIERVRKDYIISMIERMVANVNSITTNKRLKTKFAKLEKFYKEASKRGVIWL